MIFYFNLVRLPSFILDKNQSTSFIEESCKNLFKEMKLNKPIKTMILQDGPNDNKNIFSPSPQIAGISNNNPKSLGSPSILPIQKGNSQ